MPRSQEVETWFERYDNPMKEVVLRIREIILAADSRIEECIKWQAPTFTFQGNLASFFPKSKQHASLMFHLGAHIPGDHPRLEGTGDTGRIMKLGSVAEANAARRDLERLVRAWCDWRTSAAETVATKKPPVKKAVAKKPSAKKPSAKKAVAKKAVAKVAGGKKTGAKWLERSGRKTPGRG
ncbi:DUF1801 domain-containing protein [Archangium sp.]|uniref:DUF1801 domain-containing protein n=1 Tax=Archangium sp. TaxID=1872627 RepID=UPI0038999BB5